jgi:precorrin-3B synthase
MTSAFARGACPGLSAPMQTGDGLLVRLLPLAPIPLEAFIGLCEAARAHGNGIVEISARGSVQLRGLTPDSAPLFAAEIAALDIAISEGVPVIADPLPGEPDLLVDSNALADALRKAIAARKFSLAPKVSVIIDGGGRIDLDALFADIRLRAVPADGGPSFLLGLAGNAKSGVRLGLVRPAGAVDAVLDLLAEIAELGREARGADLLDGPAFPQQDDDPLPSSPRVDPVGLHRIEDGALALGVGLAFSQAEELALAELAALAKSYCARWTRPAPGRALLLGPLEEADARTVRQGAKDLGFVVEPADPRRRIAACPGAPRCLHGLIAARALAAEIAKGVPLAPGEGIALHVSGCGKGCAHPRSAPLTVVGTEKGCGIVANGTARATPTKHVPSGGVISTLACKREAVHA